MASILDLDQDGEKEGSEHNPPTQLAWKKQVLPLQIWKRELRETSVSLKVTQATSKGGARI